MTKTWANFEDRVREIASYIWDRPCKPGREAGVNVDAVLQLDAEAVVYIEITERRELNKVRDDVAKLSLAKLSANSKNIFARCFCVIEGSVTPSMAEAGEANHIKVMSIDDFQKLFFDFDAYKNARRQVAFGSAINPLTGRRDDSSYIKVNYIVEASGKEVTVEDIATWLKSGRQIVLVGEYGSGKSRCIRELFVELSEEAGKSFTYPIAIDLRESWGLKRAGELVRRHFVDLGLEDHQSSAIRAALKDSVVYLLDGFDEIGSQAWSADDQKLKTIRAKSLEGVKDLVRKSNCGVLISGREHYFPGNDEMLSALGVDPAKTILLRAKTEFTVEEMEEYFEQREIDVNIPSWLPRRPLICQVVGDMEEVEVEQIFGSRGNEAAFWNKFLNIVCARDARINVAFDAETILEVLIYLSRLTRSKSANVGPITLDDVQRAFEMVVGQPPVDEASVMLQRLPGLGRIGVESVERQFIDVSILDSLRAKDVVKICSYTRDQLASVMHDVWSNPLGDLGQRVAAQEGAAAATEMLRILKSNSDVPNKVLISDVVGTLSRGDGNPRDYGSFELDNGIFGVLDMSERGIENIKISNSLMHYVRLPIDAPKGVSISDSMAGHVYGVASAVAVPKWITGLSADHFDSASNVANIRKIGLSPGHEVLVTVIKKIFFRKGSGKKEAALMRGLGRVAPNNISAKILNILEREDLISKFKGDEGWVYTPNRTHADRMAKLTEELKFSGDPLWDRVGHL
jgi:energy-coupling factor transporter ATP-binding protein EcfA2